MTALIDLENFQYSHVFTLNAVTQAWCTGSIFSDTSVSFILRCKVTIILKRHKATLVFQIGVTVNWYNFAVGV